MKEVQTEYQEVSVDDRGRSLFCSIPLVKGTRKTQIGEKSPTIQKIIQEKMMIEEWPSTSSLRQVLRVAILNVEIREVTDPSSLFPSNRLIGILGRPIPTYLPSNKHLELTLESPGIRPKNIRSYSLQRIVVFDSLSTSEETSIFFLPQTFCFIFNNQSDVVEFLIRWEQFIKSHFDGEPFENIFNRLSVKITIERQYWVQINLQLSKLEWLKTYNWEKIGLSWSEHKLIIQKMVEAQNFLKYLTSLLKIKKEGKYNMINLISTVFKPEQTILEKPEIFWEKDLKAINAINNSPSFPCSESSKSSNMSPIMEVEQQFITDSLPLQRKSGSKSTGACEKNNPIRLIEKADSQLSQQEQEDQT